MIAIGVLLLILNWFYHRVYWAEHLADFHKRKQRILRGSHVGFISAQVLGLALLGFSSVYREGFETVLFLQALTLEAGILAVLPGVMLGLAATLAVGGPDDRARAQAAAPEDADRDRDPDDVGARDPRRHDRADVPGRRLAAGDADRGAAAAVLGRRLARGLPDLGGRRRAGGSRRLRRRQLRRRRAGAGTKAAGGSSRRCRSAPRRPSRVPTASPSSSAARPPLARGRARSGTRARRSPSAPGRARRSAASPETGSRTPSFRQRSTFAWPAL